MIDSIFCMDCVAYYSSLKAAKCILKNNTGDLHEGVYDYAVIEKMQEGLCPDVEEEYFFEFKDGKYISIEKPSKFSNFCNFALG